MTIITMYIAFFSYFFFGVIKELRIFVSNLKQFIN